MGTNLNEEGDARVFGRWARDWIAPYWRARLRGELPVGHEEMVRQYRSELERHLADLPDPSTPWGWKQPRALFLVPFLHAMHPDMKLLHVVRDGRDFANKTGFGPIRFDHVFLDAAGLAEPRPVRTTLLWRELTAMVDDYAAHELRGRYLAVRLEALVKSPAPTIRRILEFAELPPDPTPAMLAEVTRPATLGRWRELGPEIGEALTRAADPSLRRFGYVT
jgi:hypothetical protein